MKPTFFVRAFCARWRFWAPLAGALAASLVLHALALLGPHVVLAMPSGKIGTLSAVLRSVANAPVPMEAPRPPAVAEPRPVAKPLPAGAVAPVAQVGSRESQASAESVGRLPAAEVGRVAAQEEAGSAVQGTVVVPAADDGLTMFRLALSREARRYRRYPAMAQIKGWTGTAEVQITFSVMAPTPVITLGRSSGYEVIDRQAQETIGQAVRHTPLPESLRGRDLRLSIPVVFSLDD